LASLQGQRLTDFPGDEIDAAISPDGNVTAFLSNRDGPFDAWISPTGSGRFVNMTKGRFPAFYPGPIRYVGFSDDNSQLWFLEQVSLIADTDELPEGADDTSVVLMTLHAAKGLEFPSVFLVGMEDGVFPHLRSLGEPAELEEERRLAYVGITRARERLYLTNAWCRTLWGSTAISIAIATSTFTCPLVRHRRTARRPALQSRRE